MFATRGHIGQRGQSYLRRRQVLVGENGVENIDAAIDTIEQDIIVPIIQNQILVVVNAIMNQQNETSGTSVPDKKLAKEFLNYADITKILCSSDPTSLDGLIIERSGNSLL